MAWRTLLVQAGGRFRVKNHQLLCSNEDGDFTVALEEIAVVVVDTAAAQLNSYLLTALPKAGAAVVFCDKQHLPCGMLLPFHQHSRQTAMAAEQIGWSKPFRKRAWQAIVRQKVRNQAACLGALDIAGADSLAQMAGMVTSGDTGNVEARASQYYWKQLFGAAFRRTGHRSAYSSRVNGALNYGYAVVRAAVARAIASHGLLPCFGLHHDSQLNAFNLADDLIEPLRPNVDYIVARLSAGWNPKDPDDLQSEDRRALAGLGGAAIPIQGEIHSLIHAAEVTVESLSRAGRAKDAAQLVLPALGAVAGNGGSA